MLRKDSQTYIDDLDVRPGFVTDCFIMLFVIANTKIIVFDSLIRVPTLILESKIGENVIKAKNRNIRRERRS